MFGGGRAGALIGAFVAGLALAPGTAAAAIRCERCSFTLGGAHFDLKGSVELAPLHVDLTLYTPRWKLGSVKLTDVTVTVRDEDDKLRACVTGNAFESRIVACGVTSGSFEELANSGSTRVIVRATGRFAGKGSARVAWGDGGVRVTGARYSLPRFGATFALDPFRIGPGLRAATKLRIQGLDLARALATIPRSKTKLEATGTLDGIIDLRYDRRGFAIGRGTLTSRGPGQILARDPAWLRWVADAADGVALHKRIAGTLADFTYDRLVLELRPGRKRTRFPQASLALHGRGNQIDQILDLTVNLHRSPKDPDATQPHSRPSRASRDRLRNAKPEARARQGGSHSRDGRRQPQRLGERRTRNEGRRAGEPVNR